MHFLLHNGVALELVLTGRKRWPIVVGPILIRTLTKSVAARILCLVLPRAHASWPKAMGPQNRPTEQMCTPVQRTSYNRAVHLQDSQTQLN